MAPKKPSCATKLGCRQAPDTDKSRMAAFPQGSTQASHTTCLHEVADGTHGDAGLLQIVGRISLKTPGPAGCTPHSTAGCLICCWPHTVCSLVQTGPQSCTLHIKPRRALQPASACLFICGAVCLSCCWPLTCASSLQATHNAATCPSLPAHALLVLVGLRRCRLHHL